MFTMQPNHIEMKQMHFGWTVFMTASFRQESEVKAIPSGWINETYGLNDNFDSVEFKR